MSDRVLLIGNGPSALQGDLGAAIDSFDGVVARFNEFKTAGYEPQVGSRTDEWVTWTLFDEQSRRDYPRVLCVDRPPVDNWAAVKARYPQARRLKWEDVEATIARLGYEHPSSGLLTTMTYIHAGWKVVLHGFDFFQGATHHYSDNAAAGPKHSGTREGTFFRGLLMGGQVEFLDPKRQTEFFTASEAIPEPNGLEEKARGGEGVESMLWEENRKLLRLAQEQTTANFRHEADLHAAYSRAHQLTVERDALASRAAGLERAAKERDEVVPRLAATNAELERVSAALVETERQLTEISARLLAENQSLLARAEASATRESQLAAEVRRLREALRQQSRLSAQIAATDAAEVAGARQSAASAAWRHERLVQNLVRAVGPSL